MFTNQNQKDLIHSFVEKKLEEHIEYIEKQKSIELESKSAILANVKVRTVRHDHLFNLEVEERKSKDNDQLQSSIYSFIMSIYKFSNDLRYLNQHIDLQIKYHNQIFQNMEKENIYSVEIEKLKKEKERAIEEGYDFNLKKVEEGISFLSERLKEQKESFKLWVDFNEEVLKLKEDLQSN